MLVTAEQKKAWNYIPIVLCRVIYIWFFRSANDDPSGLLRDFKRHKAKNIIEVINNNPQESRKEWLLWKPVLSAVEGFGRAGKKNATTSKYQFWQHHNKPIELWSDHVIKQKIDYIHNNPIETGFATNAVDWKYSSARNFQNDNTVLEVDATGFIG